MEQRAEVSSLPQLFFIANDFDSVNRECIWGTLCVLYATLSPIVQRTILKHITYVDDICRVMDLDQIAWDLGREANRVGLKINTNKTMIPCRTDHPTLRICIKVADYRRRP